MGDDFQLAVSNELMREAGNPEHHRAKSRWILQGFHVPDIAILSRSVPTPETSYVPLSLQMLA
eukprot:6038406-Karenia_brevis.AAC.1